MATPLDGTFLNRQDSQISWVRAETPMTKERDMVRGDLGLSQLLQLGEAGTARSVTGQTGRSTGLFHVPMFKRPRRTAVQDERSRCLCIAGPNGKASYHLHESDLAGIR